jgi:aldose 1-epimerase
MVAVPSGQQFEISSGPHRACVVEVGGGVREYRVGERAVLDGYPEHEMCSGGRGTPLAPWPNRLGDGRYRFDDTEYQLALSEARTSTAIHGLLRWRNWTAREHSADRVLMGITLHPMTGYPFGVDVSIEYRLSAAGLAVRITATNVGDRACPFGTGQHPYLAAGDGLIDPATLTLDAQTWLPTDERGLPTGRAAVAGSELDFRAPRQIGGTVLDHAFTDLARDGDGLAAVTLAAEDGATTRLWLDEGYPYVQLYSGDTQSPARRRRGLAVEPMSCPADAFRSGESLARLEPGEAFTASWGISPG